MTQYVDFLKQNIENNLEIFVDWCKKSHPEFLPEQYEKGKLQENSTLLYNYMNLTPEQKEDLKNHTPSFPQIKVMESSGSMGTPETLGLISDSNETLKYVVHLYNLAEEERVKQQLLNENTLKYAGQLYDLAEEERVKKQLLNENTKETDNIKEYVKASSAVKGGTDLAKVISEVFKLREKEAPTSAKNLKNN